MKDIFSSYSFCIVRGEKEEALQHRLGVFYFPEQDVLNDRLCDGDNTECKMSASVREDGDNTETYYLCSGSWCEGHLLIPLFGSFLLFAWSSHGY